MEKLNYELLWSAAKGYAITNLAIKMTKFEIHNLSYGYRHIWNKFMITLNMDDADENELARGMLDLLYYYSKKALDASYKLDLIKEVKDESKSSL